MQFKTLLKQRQELLKDVKPCMKKDFDYLIKKYQKALQKNEKSWEIIVNTIHEKNKNLTETSQEAIATFILTLQSLNTEYRELQEAIQKRQQLLTPNNDQDIQKLWFDVHDQLKTELLNFAMQLMVLNELSSEDLHHIKNALNNLKSSTYALKNAANTKKILTFIELCLNHLKNTQNKEKSESFQKDIEQSISECFLPSMVTLVDISLHHLKNTQNKEKSESFQKDIEQCLSEYLPPVTMKPKDLLEEYRIIHSILAEIKDFPLKSIKKINYLYHEINTNHEILKKNFHETVYLQKALDKLLNIIRLFQENQLNSQDMEPLTEFQNTVIAIQTLSKNNEKQFKLIHEKKVDIHNKTAESTLNGIIEAQEKTKENVQLEKIKADMLYSKIKTQTKKLKERYNNIKTGILDALTSKIENAEGFVNYKINLGLKEKSAQKFTQDTRQIKAKIEKMGDVSILSINNQIGNDLEKKLSIVKQDIKKKLTEEIFNPIHESYEKAKKIGERIEQLNDENPIKQQLKKVLERCDRKYELLNLHFNTLETTSGKDLTLWDAQLLKKKESVEKQCRIMTELNQDIDEFERRLKQTALLDILNDITHHIEETYKTMKNDKDPRLGMLNEMKEQFAQFKERYLPSIGKLERKDNNAYFTDLEYCQQLMDIVHKQLQHDHMHKLSDGECSRFKQWIRVNIFQKIQRFFRSLSENKKQPNTFYLMAMDKMPTVNNMNQIITTEMKKTCDLVWMSSEESNQISTKPEKPRYILTDKCFYYQGIDDDKPNQILLNDKKIKLIHKQFPKKKLPITINKDQFEKIQKLTSHKPLSEHQYITDKPFGVMVLFHNSFYYFNQKTNTLTHIENSKIIHDKKKTNNMNDWNSLKSLCKTLKKPHVLLESSDACKNSESFKELNSRRVIQTVLHEKKPTFFQTAGASKIEHSMITLGCDKLKVLEDIATKLENSGNML